MNGYHSMQYTWVTTSSTRWLTTGGILAKIYVPNGGNIDFGAAPAGLSGLGMNDTHFLQGTGSTVPEPGTLALLATGLMGLPAYAWRKRKVKKYGDGMPPAGQAGCLK